MICATCGSENAAHLVFCQGCGQRLAPRAAAAQGGGPEASLAGAPAAVAIGCSHCGAKCQPGTRFCVACGSPLPVPSPSIAPRPAPRASMPAPAGVPAAPAFAAPAFAAPAFTTAPPPRAGPAPPSLRGAVEAVSLRPSATPRSSGAAPALEPAPAFPPSFVQPRSRGTGLVIVVVAKDGSAAHTVPLGDGLDIGRTEGDILLPEDAFVSARHARIAVRGGLPVLVDLGTPNGIYMRLRGASVGAAPLGFNAASAVPPAANLAGVSPSQGAPSGAMPSAAMPSGAMDWSGQGTELRDQDLFLVGQQVLEFRVVNESEEGFGPARERGTLVFGTPVAPRYARLGQRSVEGVCRDIFHIRKVETVLGREAGDIVFTDDPFLSRRHAALRMEGRRFFLADLDSSNGTFLRLRTEMMLRPGDEFRVGQQLFRLEGAGAPGALPRPVPGAPAGAHPGADAGASPRGEPRP